MKVTYICICIWVYTYVMRLGVRVYDESDVYSVHMRLRLGVHIFDESDVYLCTYAFGCTHVMKVTYAYLCT